MKKFTLLIFMMLLTITGAKAGEQTVVYKNVCTTGNYANNFTLDKSLFSEIAEGDVIWVSATCDTEGATAASETWYQLNVKYAGGAWASITSYYNMSPLGLWTHTVTAEEANSIQTYGLYFEGHFLNITEVAFGDAFSTTAVQHWDSSTSAWSTEGFTISESSDIWASVTLNTSGQLSSAKIGDRITVNYTTNATTEWGARVVLYDATNTESWTTLYDFPAGTSTSVSFLVTDDNYSNITSGDIRLGGCNYAVTSINLETSTYTYYLNAYNNNVDITKLPTSYSINVDLYRSFDWCSTICLPFDVANVSTAFDATLGSGVKTYEYTSLSESTLTFTERESMSAGVPYYMTRPYDSGISDKTATISFTDVTINTTLNNSTANDLTFTGNYTPGMDMEGYYGIACVQDGEAWVWGFYKGGEGSTLNSFSAYLEGEYTSPARLAIRTVGEVTGIENAKGIEEKQQRDNVYYNLSGQRVTNPSNGIYILNGKKVVVK